MNNLEEEKIQKNLEEKKGEKRKYCPMGQYNKRLKLYFANSLTQ